MYSFRGRSGNKAQEVNRERKGVREVVYVDVDAGGRGCVKINSNSGGRSGTPVTR